VECYLLWQNRIKISKHFSNNSDYELQLHAGLSECSPLGLAKEQPAV